MGDHKKKYMLSVDQSTQGTKALLFDKDGNLLKRRDVSHAQIINDQGWVEHDLEEIWENTKKAVKSLLSDQNVQTEEIAGIGISNQRETIAAWNRQTGQSIYHAIVWQCARGEKICDDLKKKGVAGFVKEKTGLDLSPYFSASKLAWIFQNVPEAKKLAESGMLCCGTMDSWLVYKMTKGENFKTDSSNASRTQLFNIHSLKWDEELCKLFGVPVDVLPEVCNSDALYGWTDLDGILTEKIPICGVMGDSHGALFGQGCHEAGMAKATYGTGSSVMMNVGKEAADSQEGLVSSIAWSVHGTTFYVLEGNINYTGAVITWLKDKMHLIENPLETEELARRANQGDTCYIVPAFTGLGAPYWNSDATALITGITRITGREEIAKAALECIAYQISDIVERMDAQFAARTKKHMKELRTDGGPTKNGYLMQFQSDVLNIPVAVPENEELSGMGVAYMGGISLGFYQKETLFIREKKQIYEPKMRKKIRESKIAGWKAAVKRTLYKN
ncbi:MAG: glycerol kinase GlpK [Blautia obeum]|nr:glycerol kinase GlpK [Blautia obeum]